MAFTTWNKLKTDEKIKVAAISVFLLGLIILFLIWAFNGFPLDFQGL